MAGVREVRSGGQSAPTPSGDSSKTIDLWDVSRVQLSGDGADSVPVYDTCTTIRRKIGAFLRKPSMTQTAFLRAISAATGDHRQLQSGQLKRFLMMKGPLSGNTNQIYYKAYVFFEKLRIRDKKDKSDDRREMERRHPDGMDTTRIRNRAWVPPGGTAGVDKYGMVHIY